MAEEFDVTEIKFGADPIKTDPKPNTKSRNTTRGVGRPSKENKIKEVSLEVEGFLKLLNLGLMTRDLHPVINDENELLGYETCIAVYVGTNARNLPVLTQEGRVFCDAAANVIIDSPFMMKILDGGDKAGKWLALAMALQPLVMTVVNNHPIGRRSVRPEAE